MRKLKVNEINHLIKYGFDPFLVAQTIEDNKPVEYVTERSEFYGRDFIISPDVLIPRIETEGLIVIALTLSEKNDVVSFIDVGCGSGVIGITLALELSKQNKPYRGVLVDISNNALDIANSNIKLHKVNLDLIKSDLLKNYRGEMVDLIISNLPYIPSSRIESLDLSVKDFEPRIALDGGNDGLTQIRRLLNEATKYLNKNGYVLLEVDDTHNETIAQEFRNVWDIEVRNDINEKNRYWVCKLL